MRKKKRENLARFVLSAILKHAEGYSRLIRRWGADPRILEGGGELSVGVSPCGESGSEVHEKIFTVHFRHFRLPKRGALQYFPDSRSKLAFTLNIYFSDLFVNPLLVC